MANLLSQPHLQDWRDYGLYVELFHGIFANVQYIVVASADAVINQVWSFLELDQIGILFAVAFMIRDNISLLLDDFKLKLPQ